MQSEGVNVIHSLPFNTLSYHTIGAATKAGVVDESQLFQTLWTEKYFFIVIKRAAVYALERN
jgi:hypothetical protein